MSSTAAMREAWSPACTESRLETISFGDAGARITVDRRTVPVWRAVESIFAAYRYTIRPADTGAYNCRQITGGSGYSLHAYGIAVDVNWQSNPYGPVLVTDLPPGAVREIEALSVDGRPVLRWGGRYSGNRDAMHFEVVVEPAVVERFVYDDPNTLDIGGLTVADLTKRELEEMIRKQRKKGDAVTVAQGRRTRERIAALELASDGATVEEIRRLLNSREAGLVDRIGDEIELRVEAVVSRLEAGGSAEEISTAVSDALLDELAEIFAEAAADDDVPAGS